MVSKHNSDKYKKYEPSGFPTHYKRKERLGGDLKLGIEYREIFNGILECDRKLNDIVLRSEDYFNLIFDAFTSNIHKSVSAEGNPLSLAGVRRTSENYFKKNESAAGLGPEQEILNHLSSHFEHINNIFKWPWTIETIKRTHATLTKNTGIEGMPGEFRTNDTVIVARDENGTDFICMHPCYHGNIEKELERLIEWLRSSPYDVIITAVVFFHEFESIHPFVDGNGRTGRTLFQILLRKFGLRNSKLCKFEESILRSLELYYQLLAYTDDTLDYAPLIMYISEALYHAYSNALEEFEKKDALKDMDETTKTIAKKSKGTAWFSANEASAWVPSIKQQTVRDKLNFLVAEDILEEKGNTSSKRYRFKDPFYKEKEKMSEPNE